MKILIAKDAGYCFGVRDAVNMAYDAAEKFGDKFLVGHSSRTNKKAIECLRDFVTSRGFSLHVIEVPKESLHLISICTSPMPGVLLAPEGWFDSSDFPDDTEIIWVPKSEAYGANVLPFGNDVIVAKGYEMVSKVLSEKDDASGYLFSGDASKYDGSFEMYIISFKSRIYLFCRKN